MDSQTKQMVAVTPMDLIQQAQSGETNVETMGQLMELHFKWEESEARKAYTQAMALFREEAPIIPKTRKAHNSNYAGLPEAIKIINPILTKHGFSYSWRPKQEDGQVAITCIVTHKQGHSEETTLSAAADSSGSKNAVQAIGSTITYLERYTLFAMLGLASSDDDDACGSTATYERITEDQVYDLQCKVKEAGKKENGFCTHFKIASIDLLPAAKYREAVKVLTGSYPK